VRQRNTGHPRPARRRLADDTEASAQSAEFTAGRWPGDTDDRRAIRFAWPARGLRPQPKRIPRPGDITCGASSLNQVARGGHMQILCLVAGFAHRVESGPQERPSCRPRPEAGLSGTRGATETSRRGAPFGFDLDPPDGLISARAQPFSVRSKDSREVSAGDWPNSANTCSAESNRPEGICSTDPTGRGGAAQRGRASLRPPAAKTRSAAAATKHKECRAPSNGRPAGRACQRGNASPRSARNVRCDG